MNKKQKKMEKKKKLKKNSGSHSLHIPKVESDKDMKNITLSQQSVQNDTKAETEKLLEKQKMLAQEEKEKIVKEKEAELLKEKERVRELELKIKDQEEREKQRELDLAASKKINQNSVVITKENEDKKIKLNEYAVEQKEVAADAVVQHIEKLNETLPQI